MQEFLCPQCGASVKFESAGAVMVVCGACRSTITKDAGVAKTVGHMAAVVEDGTPVQIGTRGRHDQSVFQVVGRLRMEYDAGGWNEWYLLFDDGSDGWLSDASGQYAVTRRLRDAERVAPLPAYDDVRVGQPIKVGEALYIVSDRRESRCVGGEGELPVNAADGWSARAIDCRRARAFATVDYSDGAPVVYAGKATDRADFTPGTLRNQEEVLAATGRYRGQVLALDCPECGGAISIAVAMATQVVCQSCGSLLDCTGPRTEIIEANQRVARFKTTLPLGARGRFDVEYTVIGAMRCSVPGDAEEPEWTEYLLFHPQRGYLWLVETVEGWQKVTVSDEWPAAIENTNSCTLRGAMWTKKYEYRARVESVFGAFNWRVRRGDVTRVTDYGRMRETLTREATDEEITWSIATKVSPTALALAFPKVALPKPPPAARVRANDDDDDAISSPVSVALMATMVLYVVSDNITWNALFLGAALIWAPLAISHFYGEDAW